MTAQAELLAPDSPVPPGNSPSWFTPLPWFLEAERRLLLEGLIPRQFDLDLFGHDKAPVSQEIKRRGGDYFTAERDAFRQSWVGRVGWVQPPYDAETLEHALSALYFGALAGAVALLPAFTDRKWWHRHIEPGRRRGRIEVRFVEGRMRFGWPENPPGLGADSAMFPSVLVVWLAAAEIKR